ncbi:MAG TPA: polyprenol monophosphomannose synthase [Galbitalea sp.]|nr:polyprenol monophosphomannose synthase [Galbitalea sp.]
MSSSQTNDVLVVIPTYNEIDNLSEMTRRILAANDEVDILVVDDNSPDGTGRLADELSLASDRISVLHRPGKSGIGNAYRAGFGWGLRAGYQYLVEMDGDGSHRPEQLPALLTAARNSDVVLGSRWAPGGSAPNWALHRRLLSRAGSLYARVALALPFSDITGGYRVFRATALTALGYQSVEAQGYCFQIEMLWRAREAGLRIVEVPIDFAERLSGSSKMSLAIVVEAISRVTIWGIGDLPHRLRRAGRSRQAASLLSDGSDASRAPLHRGLAAIHSVDGRD